MRTVAVFDDFLQISGFVAARRKEQDFRTAAGYMFATPFRDQQLSISARHHVRDR